MSSSFSSASEAFSTLPAFRYTSKSLIRISKYCVSRFGVLSADAIQLRDKVVLFAVRIHPILDHLQDFHRLGILPRFAVDIDQVEKARESLIFILHQALQ